jgi:hypothetical protein
LIQGYFLSLKVDCATLYISILTIIVSYGIMLPMSNEQAPLSGFEAPQVPQGRWVAGLFEKHGLGETPSLADIEPVAKGLWEDPRTKLEAAELVLGRRVDSGEISADPTLAGEISADPTLAAVYLTPDADQAFGLLLLVKDMETDRSAGEQ